MACRKVLPPSLPLSHLKTPESTPALLRKVGSVIKSATASRTSPALMFPVGSPDKLSPAPASITLRATS